MKAAEIVLNPTQLADLELLVNGGYAPLKGFMTREQYVRVIDNHRLGTGESWDIPIVLAVSAETAERVSSSGRLTLVHPEGIPLGIVEDASVWELDGRSPGYQHIVSGAVTALAGSVHYDFNDIRLSPGEYLSKLANDPSTKVIGFTSSNPIRPEDLEAILSEASDGHTAVLLAPITPPDLGWDRRQFDLVRSYSTMLSRFANVSVDLVLIPAPHVNDDELGMALRKSVLRNYGCDRIMTASGSISSRPVGEEAGTEFGVNFPDVEEILAGSNPPLSERGFTVFFTGLPCSGKSTLANYLVGKLMEDGGRSVTLLDGDIVRRNLSSEIGFSREDRDTNIRRIGYVASEITKAGGVAVCAPIAPYDSVRQQVRTLVSRYGKFIEVYVSTPIEVCEQRDRKGLYAKARAGIIKGFTGVDDPYEQPTRAELEIDTSRINPLDAVSKIVDHLIERGLIG